MLLVVLRVFMSGLMAVVMLMLVVSVLQKNASEIAYKEELAKAEVAYKEELAKAKESKNDPVAKMMKALNTMIQTRSATEFISLNTRTNRMTLRDGVFERGSACLKPEARAAVESVQKYLADFLRENLTAHIFVEGYTDNLPVKNPVVDYQRFCTVYDDNFTLSAARAREARRYLIGSLDQGAARRIVVAGYGESKPLFGVDPADSKNRRVEVLFMIEKDER